MHIKYYYFVFSELISGMEARSSSGTSWGVHKLLEDLLRLSEDHESADVVFLIGKSEEKIYAHRIILMAR